jgi:hypothetical protein
VSEDLNALKAKLAEIAKSLKANHLKMAKALADGKTQEESYRLSGGKAKDGYAAASEMIKLNPKISQYATLAKQIAVAESQAKLIATTEQKRQMLWEIAQKASVLKVGVKGSEDPETGEFTEEVFDASAAKTAVAAIAELNKMDGDHAAIKLDNKISGSLTVESLIEELTGGTTK